MPPDCGYSLRRELTRRKAKNQMSGNKQDSKGKRGLWCALAIAAMVLAIVVLYALWASRYMLRVTRYELASGKLTESVRMVQLSDLHNAVFGEDNALLIAQVKAQSPDLIVMTGDMINGKEQKTGTTEALIRALKEIAPVYASLGNHEQGHRALYRIDVKKLYGEAGAIVLDKTYHDVTVKGQKIRLGGLLGYALPERFAQFGEAVKSEYVYLQKMQKTERLTVFLCHYPTCFIKDGILDDWNIDVVFSGHEHGGQIRLPWLGGVYAPDRGFFPGGTSGVTYSTDGKKALVLSRGLGSTGRVPRLNNVPEIVVVDIIAQEQ